MLNLGIRFAIAFIALSSAVISNAAEVVVADGSVQITRAEFEAALATAAPRIRRAAASDVGDRFEFINGMVAARKLAAKADQLQPEDEGYWDLQFAIIAAKRQLAFDQELAGFQIPDIEPLAREYYETRKEQFARIAETRASSHILLASPPGRPREGVRAKAQEILDQLRAGADFDEMVQKHSDDPGTKRRKGSLDRWIRLGQKDISPPYTGGLFAIDEVGGYSEITDTEFGVHVIRLDGIREARFKTYEEARADIVNYIMSQYRSLASKAVNARHNVSDEVVIDGSAMEELFAPYK